MLRPGTYRLVPFLNGSGYLNWRVERRRWFGLYFTVTYHYHWEATFGTPELAAGWIAAQTWERARLKQYPDVRRRRMKSRVQIPKVVKIPPEST